MKKISVTMVAIAALIMVSCEKEPFADSEASVPGNDIITASTEDNLSKTYLNGSDSEGYDVFWTEGDKITIAGNPFTLIAGEGTTNGTFRGTFPKDGTYSASYNGSADNWPQFWMHSDARIIGGPMTAEVTISGGKVTEPLKFKNAGGVLRLTLKGTATVSEIVVYGFGEIHLRCAGGVSLDNIDGKVFHLPLPAMGVDGPLIQIFTNDGLDIRKQMKSDKRLFIERSKITDVSISGINSTIPAGILPGRFSVAEGRQVHFSRGNLRYTVDSRKWSFFDKQYDCGPSEYEDGHDKEISLFTWGYNPTKSIIPGGGDYDNVNVSSGNLNLNQDWGSQIGSLGTWRTLTKAEWDYLFTVRTDADKKYGYATVCGVKGIIILPDEFQDPLTNGGSGRFKPKSSDNVYISGGNWEAMEYAGAVFLPIAGSRSGDRIYFMDYGFYWSSTAANTSRESDEGKQIPTAYYVLLDKSETPRTITFYRSSGCSVRLVSGTYTVSFDLNGKPGTAPKSIGNLLFESLVKKPSDSPATKGYVFTGWYKDPECKNRWDFDNDLVRENVTLYAGWTDRLISGKFTVAEGRQVYFSRGNLWVDGSNALHFEDNQWGFNNSYDRNHVSHFTWSAEVSGAAGTSGSGGYLFCDKNHKVSVNGSAPIYYALTKDEWKYLFYTDDGRQSRIMKYNRPTHSCNIRYNFKTGLVIYPDDYNGDVLVPGEDYTEETFPEGCVFLPGAGWRDGSTVRMAGNFNGFYWSSSAAKSQKVEPYNLQFTTSSVDISETGNHNNALSLRLVIDAE